MAPKGLCCGPCGKVRYLANREGLQLSEADIRRGGALGAVEQQPAASIHLDSGRADDTGIGISRQFDFQDQVPVFHRCPPQPISGKIRNREKTSLGPGVGFGNTENGYEPAIDRACRTS